MEGSREEEILHPLAWSSIGCNSLGYAKPKSGEGALEAGPHSALSGAHQQGVESEMEQPRFEPVSIWECCD